MGEKKDSITVKKESVETDSREHSKKEEKERRAKQNATPTKEVARTKIRNRSVFCPPTSCRRKRKKRIMHAPSQRSYRFG